MKFDYVIVQKEKEKEDVSAAVPVFKIYLNLSR